MGGQFVQARQALEAMAYLYQIIVGGVHNGLLYALLAYGYVLLHTVVPKPNLAHGALFAFSGQILVLASTFAYNVLIFTLAASLGFGAAVAALLSLLVLALMAFHIVPRFADRGPNMMIVTTLALALVLMEAVRIGSDGRDFWLPPLSDQRLLLGLGAMVTQVQALNISVMLLLLAVSEWVLRGTSAGRCLRAVSDDKRAAALLGVNVHAVIVAAGFAAGALALLGGVMAVLHFGNMSFGAGLTYGLKVLFIASAGGFSTPRQAAIAAFLFGEAESLWDGYLPVLWRETFFYAALAIMLVLRGKTTMDVTAPR